MASFTGQALNPGVRKREVFGWAMYDFANSGYTTVVLTAVFAAYFVGGVAGGAPWATLAWTAMLAFSSLLVMLKAARGRRKDRRHRVTLRTGRPGRQRDRASRRAAP